MRKAALGVAVVYGFLLSSLTFAQDNKPVNTFPLEKITAGMHGVAYTVFQGTTPEPMDVEVLGVLKNANGPKGDIILVRLGGEKANYTGVVAGMSGSPVYFEGKLAGAVAFRIGEFSKEPIAGVTPISEMLEISSLDTTPTSVPVQAKSLPSLTSKTSGPGAASVPVQSFANYLKPIETPLVFSGFSEDAVQKFAPQFASQGIVPVMGVGSASSVKQPEPLVPGSAVSAVLVSGDMNIAATCTVTYIDPSHLLACGHPLMQFGMVDLPMTKAQVLATLPSPLNAFKIVNATETVGSEPVLPRRSQARVAAGLGVAVLGDPRGEDRRQHQDDDHDQPGEGHLVGGEPAPHLAPGAGDGGGVALGDGKLGLAGDDRGHQAPPPRRTRGSNHA